MQKKQEQIYNAVLRLMAACENPADITISHIADEAGIGKGTVYEYFKSKEEIYAKAFVYLMDQKIGELSKLLCGKGFQEGFYAMADYVLDNLKNNQSLFQILFVSQRLYGFHEEFLSVVQQKKEEKRLELTGILTRFADKGKEEGLLPRRPKEPDLLFAFLAVMQIINLYSADQDCGMWHALSPDTLFDFCYHKFLLLLCDS